MPFPIRTCAICSEEFELKPGKPGFANHCPTCTAEQEETKADSGLPALDPKATAEVNAARREAMRNLLYRKDS
jgi:hypothetical protein